jgi:hypothetical protein
MVSRDPHEEGFDFGPHVRLHLHKRADAFRMIAKSGPMHCSPPKLITKVDVSALGDDGFNGRRITLASCCV